MKFNVDIDNTVDPDFAGEFIMNIINPQYRWGYMTTETTSEFEEFSETPSLKILTYLKGCFAKTCDLPVTMIKHIDLNIKVYLWWDGDGTIVIDMDGDYLVNVDMKKHHGWEWNPDWVDDLPEKYYEIDENWWC